MQVHITNSAYNQHPVNTMSGTRLDIISPPAVGSSASQLASAPGGDGMVVS